eukprot:jgi/Botrbrau1/8772/Bobra.0330s0006.1
MVDGDPLALAPVIVRGIGDKLYEKRKAGALEVEQLVKQLAAQGPTTKPRITQILDRLVQDYVYSPLANSRKGGLLALAAAAVALAELSHGEGVDHDYLQRIVPPVLALLVDQDARVRYYACEALYNIAKVARNDFMPYFAQTFDALFRLCADPDAAVSQAVTFLDNIIKDIVTASPNFEMDAFVPQLKEALTVMNPRKRNFIISWVRVLSSVPDIEVLNHLADLLEGLTDALQENWPPEVRMNASRCLQEFLVEIQTSKQADFGALARIMGERVASPDENVRLVALRWLRDFVEHAKQPLLPHYPAILAAILPALATGSEECRQLVELTNKEMMEVDDGLWTGLDVAGMLEVVGRDLRHSPEATRLQALAWINTLLIHSREKVLEQLEVLLPALFDALEAGSEKVAVQALTVMATLAQDPRHFRRLMQLLLDRFRLPGGRELLERRGSMTMRRLCTLLGAQPLFSTLSSILAEEVDLHFGAAMVQALNLILLTAPETKDLRAQLQRAGHNHAAAELLQTLYPTWCLSPGALLALCLLGQSRMKVQSAVAHARMAMLGEQQKSGDGEKPPDPKICRNKAGTWTHLAYEHVNEIVGSYGQLPMSVETLVQLDRLVQLLETPTFTLLRLHLLRPALHPFLLKALYGLLMLLPQSNAFKMLQARLHSVPLAVLLQLEEAPGVGRQRTRAAASSNGAETAGACHWEHMDFEPLLELFQKRQVALYEEDERRRLGGMADGDRLTAG